MLSVTFSFYLTVLLLCHFIGDYYLQTNKMAQEKENNIRNTLIHSILYGLPFAVLLFILILLNALNIMTAGIIAGAVIMHAVIDLIKCIFEKTVRFRNHPDFNRTVYVIDQILHFVVILIGAFILSSVSSDSILSIHAMLSSNLYSDIYSDLSSILYSDLYFLLKCVLFIVIISKPVNVSFKKIFEKYQPVQKTDGNEIEPNIESISGAGATIGILERLLIGIFIGTGQFAALGLVVAAKSIARYDQISKNKLFAEYFLIGTLYSVLTTLIVYYILFEVVA